MSAAMFKDKTLLITGGTGSFGNAVLSRMLAADLRQLLRRKLSFFTFDDLNRVIRPATKATRTPNL